MSINTRKFRVYFIILFAFWTCLVVVHSIFQYREYKKGVVELATKEANLTFLKDSLYRRWVSMHGGVYVPASKMTPPNPYLAHVENRDIVTPDGVVLTLVNPAYMTRQVYEMADEGVIQGHLTSDKLINPVNKPDEWEAVALKAVLSGAEMYSGTDIIDDEPYLRFMKPFITEEGCLHCHAFQNYEVGDIRGGISVSVPLKDYYNTFENKSLFHVTLNTVIWLFVAILLAYTFLRLSAMMRREELAGEEKDTILKELNHRVKNNLQIISSIIDIHRSKESSYDKDELLEDIQGRLISMSTMHNMFVSDKEMVGVESGGYFRKIVDHFSSTYNGRNGSRTAISLKSDAVILTGTQAVSCGLILNELLTNSFKYAFNNTVEHPEIKIWFSKKGETLTLSYQDNGIGFDYSRVTEKPDSLGFLLINSMAEKIGAESSISGENGLKAEFRFSNTVS